jgi:rSAM/selenodomain-associated transferase 1
MTVIRLVLFTRFPEPGLCKTRLIPAIGPHGAAKVHAALTEAALACLGPAAEVHFVGGAADAFAAWLGDGPRYISQSDGDLGARLTAALDPAPVIFFGSDTPDLTAEIVAEAQAALLSHDVVIGPAEDGGYYLIGMNAPHRALFHGMPWSTNRLCDETLATCESLGLSVAILEALSDCDTPEDLARWPWLHP